MIQGAKEKRRKNEETIKECNFYSAIRHMQSEIFYLQFAKFQISAYNGTTVQPYNGTTVQRYNRTTVQPYNRTTPSRGCKRYNLIQIFQG